VPEVKSKHALRMQKNI